MFISELFVQEEKQLDPELYEELPNAFLKRIVQNALPGVPLKFRNTPEGYLSVRADDGSVKLDIGTSIAAGNIGFNIENAYLTKHQGAGVMTKIISDAYQAVERKYGKPQSRSLNIMQDRSHGAWQAIASKLGAEYSANSQIDEITTVPTVAKGKREHLDVMPNEGRPIPPGDEANYMGNKVGNLGSVEVWTYNQGPMKTFVVFDPETRTSQLAVTGSSYPANPDSFIIKGVYSGPKNQVRAANLYAWLITKLGLTLVSDIKQSAGGQRVWQDLERRFGRYLNIHGFNTKTNEPVNVGSQDDAETHVGQEHLPRATRDIKNIAKNIRLVASPK